MATVDAIHAFGMELHRSDGNPNNPTWQKISFVNNLNPPGGTSDAIETTHHDTPDKFRTYIAGLKTTDDITCNINYIPSDPSHQAMLDDWTTGIKRDWRVVAKSGDTVIETFEVSAFVMNFSISTPIDDRMTADVTLKPSGGPSRY